MKAPKSLALPPLRQAGGSLGGVPDPERRTERGLPPIKKLRAWTRNAHENLSAKTCRDPVFSPQPGRQCSSRLCPSSRRSGLGLCPALDLRILPRISHSGTLHLLENTCQILLNVRIHMSNRYRVIVRRLISETPLPPLARISASNEARSPLTILRHMQPFMI